MINYLRYKKWYKAIKESGLFDVKYYLFTYPDIREQDIDPIWHYIRFGAKEGRNPSTEFDTQFYLSMNIDVELSNLNPLVHYILHGKNEKRRIKTLSKEIVENHIDKDCMLKFKPKISIIVPNYNHAKFLVKRIDSILNQTYTNFELLLLDDCSSDNSRKILLKYERNYPEKIRTIFNEKNAGNVFKQWEKGIEHSKGELIWICESDDFCEDDFLEKIVRHFENPAVNLAFGKIQFCDLNDNFMQGLDSYREGAEKGIWNSIQVRPAKTWFCNGFGINNVIANVGGCVFKKEVLDSKVWDKAKNYKILGDWFLYAHVANGGLIAYEPSAIAYFRQHGANTSINSFITSKYYQEHFDLMKTLKEMWPIPNSTIDKFYSKIEFQYKHFKCEEKLGKLEQYVNTEVLKDTQKNKKHILISMLAFHSGGGELFPINLANALQKEGSIVSLFVFNMNDINLDMYNLVDKRIAIYSKDYVESYGVANFIDDAGIDLINSHMVSLDNFFLLKHNINIPYFPTLHGSYEACNVPNQMVKNISKKVTSWIYTADKNLNTLKFLNIPKNKLIKLANAMPIDDEPFPKARVDLGIPEDDIVFTLVARGIKRKGWRAAIEAFLKLEQKYSNIHLLLCGEGTETEKYKQIYEKHKKITFLGYQSKIHGLYRISDCAIVPTRFEGESYPLCIIQALQVGLPVIATDVGEIKSMLTDSEGEVAGIILANERNTQLFIKNLELAMNQVIDVERRKKYSNVSKKIAKRYSISDLVTKYLEIFNNKKTIYIHIGIGKTGTSSIQEMLLKNMESFLMQNVLIPKTGIKYGMAHHNLAKMGEDEFSEATKRIYEDLVLE
ncbi:glycosyltransferase, partial [Sulfurimonas sp.]